MVKECIAEVMEAEGMVIDPDECSSRPAASR